MVLMDTGSDPDLELREITTLLDRQVDGIVYAAKYHRQSTGCPTRWALPDGAADAGSDWAIRRARRVRWRRDAVARCSPTVTAGSAT